jgi:hypothetical protein
MPQSVLCLHVLPTQVPQERQQMMQKTVVMLSERLLFFRKSKHTANSRGIRRR